MDHLRRPVALAALLRAIRSAAMERDAFDLPDPQALDRVRHAADRADGLPRLVAEIMAAYASPNASPSIRSSKVVGGRRTARDADDETGWPSTPHQYSFLGSDLRVIVALLRLSTSVSADARASTALVLRQLADDARMNASRVVGANALAVSHVLKEIAGIDLDVAVGSNGVLSAMRVTASSRVDATDLQVRLLVEAGVVLGQLGAVGTTKHLDQVSHWELARRISDRARTFALSVIDDRAGEATVLRAAQDAGVPVEFFEPIMAGVRARLRPLGRGRGSVDVTLTSGLLEVPDPLGSVYALAELVAISQVAG